jgi:acyl-CoA-binding protein
MIVSRHQSRSRPAGKTTMTDLDIQFTQAQEDVKQLTERPGNLTLLRLYALFKQASEGDVRGDKPGFTDIVGKYKYDAWAALKGTAQDAAKQQYVELVELLKSGAAA